MESIKSIHKKGARIITGYPESKTLSKKKEFKLYFRQDFIEATIDSLKLVQNLFRGDKK